MMFDVFFIQKYLSGNVHVYLVKTELLDKRRMQGNAESKK